MLTDRLNELTELYVYTELDATKFNIIVPEITQLIAEFKYLFNPLRADVNLIIARLYGFCHDCYSWVKQYKDAILMSDEQGKILEKCDLFGLEYALHLYDRIETLSYLNDFTQVIECIKKASYAAYDIPFKLFPNTRSLTDYRAVCNITHAYLHEEDKNWGKAIEGFQKAKVILEQAKESNKPDRCGDDLIPFLSNRMETITKNLDDTLTAQTDISSSSAASEVSNSSILYISHYTLCCTMYVHYILYYTRLCQ